MTQRADAHIVAASVPLSEMFGYSTTLRSMSQGRAIYSMEFSHYQEVPKAKAEEIVSKGKARQMAKAKFERNKPHCERGHDPARWITARRTLTAALTKVSSDKGLATYISYDQVAKASESRAGAMRRRF